MKATIVGSLMLAACHAAPPELPWVHGLDGVTGSTGIAAPRAPADDLEPGCGVAASRTIELVADVAPQAGKETIVGSYSGGLAIFDREDHLIAETAGYPCEGSADELDVIAVGSAYGTRMLVLAATTGGHRESSTFVGLYRLAGNKLDPMFAGEVERRDDLTVKRGSITFIPGGLVYQRPDGPARFWRFDPATKIYMPSLPDEPHDEPLLSQR